MTTEKDQRPFLRLGFRTRVFGVLALLLVGAVVAGVIIERAVLLARHDRAVEAAHDQEHTELDQLARGRNPRTGKPFESDAKAVFDTFLRRNVPGPHEQYLTFVEGDLYRSSVDPSRVSELPAGLLQQWSGSTNGSRGTSQTEIGELRWLAVPLLEPGGKTAGVFVIATNVGDSRAEIFDTVRVEAVISALVLLAALAIAWLVAGRLLRPLRDVTESARNLSETDLSQRIPVSGHDDIAQLARTYNSMLDRLEAAFVTQRRFLDDAGHELRTPITIMGGHLELMGDDPEDRRETVALVTDELDRMSRMVNDLLLLAKAQQPNFLERAPVPAEDLIAGLVDRSLALGDRSWVSDGHPDATANVDEQRIVQAVLNLARNAVEHTDPAAEIGIGAAVDGDWLHVWVRDTGPGVPPEDRERLFDRFARGSRSRYDGAGLGLSIVAAIAESHGGRASVEEAAGGGALFRIVVAAGPVTHHESEPEPDRWEPMSGSYPSAVDPDAPTRILEPVTEEPWPES